VVLAFISHWTYLDELYKAQQTYYSLQTVDETEKANFTLLLPEMASLSRRHLPPLYFHENQEQCRRSLQQSVERSGNRPLHIICVVLRKQLQVNKQFIAGKSNSQRGAALSQWRVRLGVCIFN